MSSDSSPQPRQSMFVTKMKSTGEIDICERIERVSFSKRDRWSASQIKTSILKQNAVGLVAHCQIYGPIGYCIVFGYPKRMCLKRIVVMPEHRRCGAGRALIKQVIEKMAELDQDTIVAYVPEENLACQLFLREMGFFAEAVFGGAEYQFSYDRDRGKGQTIIDRILAGDVRVVK